LLRTAGLSCDHAGEIGMSKAEDPDIIEWARAHDAVVIAIDADFHAELAVSGASKPSVIRLRLQGLEGAAVAKLVLGILEDHALALAEGCMITVKHHKITLHKLPVGRS
jgi:predicted nuclease of predicted toxin-antitoxin system